MQGMSAMHHPHVEALLNLLEVEDKEVRVDRIALGHEAAMHLNVSWTGRAASDSQLPSFALV